MAKLLAIDDKPDNLITLTAVLKNLMPGCVVMTALSGLEGISKAKSEQPDVILLDVKMPDMDGFETCRILMSDESTSSIPVIMITAIKTDQQSRIKGLDLGANAFLAKPIDEVELISQIQVALRIKKAEDDLRKERNSLELTVQERTAALRAGEETYRALVEGLPDIVMRFDCIGRHLFVSKNVRELMGLEATQLIGKTHRELDFPEEQSQFWEQAIRGVFRTKTPFETEFAFQGKRGSVIFNWRLVPERDDYGAVRSVLSICRDVTEIREIQTRLRQSEKMEAVGRLAGGIAHDFNNILAGIIGFTEMSLHYVEKDSVPEENLQQVLKAADRAKQLVRQILMFSRQSDPQKSVMALQPIIREVLDLLRASIPSSVHIASDLQANTKPVLADPTRMHEVLINLATNAVYAMDRKGTLTVRLYTAVLDRMENGRAGEIVPGEYAVMEVGDTGCGMDPETLLRVFEPFYTTKSVGEGTGMGLSVVLGIMQSHGGNLQVESAPGKGSTFKLYLPIAQESIADGVKHDPRTSISGSERILFVDDEPMLTRMAFNMLSKLGYHITCMNDSMGALKYIGDKEKEIDLLITDQTMPLMTGLELAKEALKIRKDLPIILCTGNSNEINPRRMAAIGVSRLLAKPFGTYEIGRSIRDLLDGRMKGESHG